MIRNLIRGEVLPEALSTGYEGGQCDTEWIFVCEREGKPVVVLVAAPVHIAVLVVRLISTKDAHSNDVRSILLHFLATIKERGYQAYFTYINPQIEAERVLGEIIKQAEGTYLDKPQFLCVGAV